MDSKKLYSALYRVTTNSPQWKALQGIYHKEGELIASNDAALVVVKYAYPTHLEGSVITSVGSWWTETLYPNYKMLLPRKLELMATPQYPLEDIIEACKRLPKNEAPSEKPTGPVFLLNVGGTLFDPLLLLNILRIFTVLGEKPKLSIMDSTDNRLALISENCTAVVTPAKARTELKCEAYDIAEMLEYGDLL